MKAIAITLLLILLPSAALATHTCLPGDYYKRRECFIPPWTEHPFEERGCRGLAARGYFIAALHCMFR